MEEWGDEVVRLRGSRRRLRGQHAETLGRPRGATHELVGILPVPAHDERLGSDVDPLPGIVDQSALLEWRVPVLERVEVSGADSKQVGLFHDLSTRLARLDPRRLLIVHVDRRRDRGKAGVLEQALLGRLGEKLHFFEKREGVGLRIVVGRARA